MVHRSPFMRFLKDAGSTIKSVGDYGKSAFKPLIGAAVQNAAGKIAAFKKGGQVKGPKGKPQLAIVHGGEYVLPHNCKPTKAQKAVVAKNKGKK